MFCKNFAADKMPLYETKQDLTHFHVNRQAFFVKNKAKDLKIFCCLPQPRLALVTCRDYQ